MSAFPSRHKDNSEEATGLLFMRVYNAWHREIKRRLRELDITHPQFVVLAIIGYLAQCNNEISQTMIAAHADMDVMSASQILNLMEKSGLIRRTTHSRDSRPKPLRSRIWARRKCRSPCPWWNAPTACFSVPWGNGNRNSKPCCTLCAPSAFPARTPP